MKKFLALLYLIAVTFLLGAQRVSAQSAILNAPADVCQGSFATMNAHLTSSNANGAYTWTLTSSPGTVTSIYGTFNGQVSGTSNTNNTTVSVQFNAVGSYTFTVNIPWKDGSKSGSLTLTKTIVVHDCSIDVCYGVDKSGTGFNEDFGQITDGLRHQVQAPASISYTFQGGTSDVEDNYYCLATSTFQHIGWVNKPDHTTGVAGGTGAMLVCNSQNKGLAFYSRQIDNLCPGAKYNFSSYLMNLNTQNILETTCASGYMYAGVDFQIINAANNALLATFPTYDVSMGIPVSTWQRYGGTFKTPPGVTSIIFKMVNRNPGGCGNDIAVDDITFSYCGPQMYTYIDGLKGLTENSICQNQPVNLTGSVSPINYFSNPVYFWQDSIAGQPGWNDITIDGTLFSKLNDSTLHISGDVLMPDGSSPLSYFFRVKVVESGQDANGSCARFSDPATLTVLPVPVISVDQQEICKGDVVHLVTQKVYSHYKWTYGVPQQVFEGDTTDGPFNTLDDQPLITTDYTVTASVKFGKGKSCSRNAIATVIVDTIPVGNLQPLVSTICVNTPITLNANPNIITYPILWSTGETTPSIEVNKSAAGTYYFTDTLYNGVCKSYQTDTLNVRALPHPTVLPDTLKNCSNSTFTLNGNTPESGQQGTWIIGTPANGATIDPTEIHNPTATLTGLMADSMASLVWNVKDTLSLTQCDSSAKLVVWNRPIPTTAVINQTTLTNCTGSFNLTANNGVTGETGTWTIVSNTSGGSTGVVITNINSASTTVKLSGAQTQTVVLAWTLNNGTCDGPSDQVTLHYAAPPTITVGSVPSSCSNTGSFTLPITSFTNNPTKISISNTGTPVMAGFIPVVNDPVDFTQSLPINYTVHYPLTTPAGTYNFTVTPLNDSSACTGTPVTFTVTINTPSSAPTSVSASPTALCVSGNSTLTVSGGTLGSGAKWQWTTSSCSGTVLGTGTASSQTVTLNTTTTYFVKAVDPTNTCASTICAQVTVKVDTIPVGKLSPVISNICLGSSVTLDAAPTKTGYGIDWSTGATSQTIIVTPALVGSYPYTVTLNNGACSSIQNATINVLAIPTAQVSTNSIKQCENGTFTLSGNQPAADETGTWTLMEPLNGATIATADIHKTNPTITGLATGQQVIAVWTVTNNTNTQCASTANVVLWNRNKPTTATVTDASIRQCSNVFSIEGNQPAAGETGKWTVVSTTAGTTVSFANASQYATTATLSGPATQDAIIAWTLNNGTCDGTSATITLHYVPVPTITVGNPADACDISTTNFTLPITKVTGGPTYITIKAVTPNKLAGFVDIIDHAFDSTATKYIADLPASITKGTYNFTVSVKNDSLNCVGEDVPFTLTVKESAKAPASVSASPDVLCESGSSVLTVNGGSLGENGQWQWSTGSCTGTVLGTGTATTHTVTLSTTTTYFVKAVDPTNTCASTICAQVTVKVDTIPVGKLSPATSNICLGSSVTLDAAPTKTSYGIKWNSGVTTQTISVSPTSVGTYSYTDTLHNGACFSYETATVNVLAIPIAHVSIDTVKQCENGTFTLSGNQPAADETGTWTLMEPLNGATIAAADIHKTNPTITGLTTGQQVKAVWSVTNNTNTQCASTDTVVVWNRTKPTTATVTDASIRQCSNVFSIEGNQPAAGETGKWTVVSTTAGTTVSFANASQYATTATLSGPATQDAIIAWTLNNGTCDGASATITLHYVPVPTITVGTPAAICDIVSTQFTLPITKTTGGPTYITIKAAMPNKLAGFVDVIDHAFDSTATKYIVDLPASITKGTYNFTVSVKNDSLNCVGEDVPFTLTVKGSAKAPASVSASPAVLCESGSSVLTVNGGSLGDNGQWQWSTGSCTGTVLGTGTATTHTVTLSATTTYFVKAVDPTGTCVSTICVPVTVKVDTIPVGKLSPATSNICLGSSVTLDAAPTKTDYSIKWNSGVTTQTISVSPTSVGTYSYTDTLHNGACFSYETATVNVLAIPIAHISIDTVKQCENGTFTLSGNQPAANETGTWTLLAPVNGATIAAADIHKTNPTITGLTTGQQVKAVWSVTNNTNTQCASTDTVVVWNRTKPTTATVTDASIRQCSNVFSIEGNQPAAGETGKWTVISTTAGTTVSFANASQYATTATLSGPATQDAIIAWTLNNGTCDGASATITLHYVPVPTITVGNPADACDISTTNFTLPITKVTGGPTYITIKAASPNKLPGFVDITDATFDSTALQYIVTLPATLTAGTYNFTVSVRNDSLNCTGVAVPFTLKIKASAQTPDSLTASVKEICASGAVTLTVHGVLPPDAVWEWSDKSCGGAIIAKGVVATLTRNITTTTTFYVRAVDTTATCSSSACASVKVTVDAMSSAPVAGNNQEHCDNANFTMTATTPVSGTGNWILLSGSATIANKTNPLTNVTVPVGKTAVLGWYTTNGICNSDTAKVTLTNYPPLSNNVISENQRLCLGSDPALLTGTIAGGDGSYTYQWQSAATADGIFNNITGATGATYQPTQLTDSIFYRRIVNARTGCTDISNVVRIIVVNKGPVVKSKSPDKVVECNGSADYSANFTQPVFEHPFGLKLTVTHADNVSGSCPMIIVRTWTATDSCGNSTAASQQLTIQDVTKPTFTTPVPADVTVLCSAVQAQIDLSYTDNCSPQDKITYEKKSVRTNTGNCENTYTITNTWTITDVCGNTNSVQQLVHVIDTVPPVFTVTAPADITVNCDKIPTQPTLYAKDACNPNPITAVADERREDIPGACANNYRLVRTWTAYDACGNKATLTQIVTVIDNTKPTFPNGKPADKTVECNAIPVQQPIPVADNCSATDKIVQTMYTWKEVISGACANNYKLHYTWVAKDECGNIDSVSQIITVRNTQKPTFDQVMPRDTTINCDQTLGWPTITASSACGTTGSAKVVTSKTTKTSGSCAKNYTETRTWTATDECGNVATWSQSINVQDTTRPVFTMKIPRDTTVSCDSIPAAPQLAGTDNCSTSKELSGSYSVKTIKGNCANSYTLIRTWILRDACGNQNTATQTVTVRDMVAPVIQPAPADITIYCQDLIPAHVSLNATDNCDASFPKKATYSEDPYVKDICNGYTIVRRWSAIDACGNIATQVIQRVIIKPCSKPALIDSLDITCSSNPYVTLRTKGTVNRPTYTLTGVEPAGIISVPVSQTYNVFNLKGATSATFIVTDGLTGCVSDPKTYSLKYNTSPVVNLGKDTTICGGNSLVLDAGAANFKYNIVWSTGEKTQRINISKAGTYWVTVTNANCVVSDTIKVGLIPTPLVNIPDTTICRGQTVKLDAYVKDAGYLWSNGATSSSILVGAQDEYWVKVSKNGCITIDTVNVTVNPPPDIQLKEDTSICPGQSVMLTVTSNGGRIRWINGSTQPSITVTKPGGYWVTVTKDNCVVRDTVNVREKPKLKLELGPDQSLCPGTEITLDATNADAISYLWNDGDPNPVKTIGNAGFYKIAVMDKYCQMVTFDSVNVTMSSIPVVNLGNDTIMCNGEVLTLTPKGSNIRSVQWSDGSTGSTLKVTKAGTYTVTAFNECGSSTDQITVSFQDCIPDPTFPNAFSPNGDGKNDIFLPTVRGPMYNYELRIFNRWGQLIFLSTDAKKGWDGTFNGEPVDIGTYVWWLSYKVTPGGPANVLKGAVTLIR